MFCERQWPIKETRFGLEFLQPFRAEQEALGNLCARNQQIEAVVHHERDPDLIDSWKVYRLGIHFSM